jgi:hypothetical protein
LPNGTNKIILYAIQDHVQHWLFGQEDTEYSIKKAQLDDEV